MELFITIAVVVGIFAALGVVAAAIMPLATVDHPLLSTRPTFDQGRPQNI